MGGMSRPRCHREAATEMKWDRTPTRFTWWSQERMAVYRSDFVCMQTRVADHLGGCQREDFPVEFAYDAHLDTG